MTPRRLVHLLVLLSPALAAAQQAASLPNFSLSRFTLSDGGRAGLGAATGDVLPGGRFRATLGFHYENGPLIALRDDLVVGAIVAHRLQLHLGLGYGVTSWLQVTGELPIVVYQAGDNISGVTGIAAPDPAGLGSTRLAARAQLLSQKKGGLFAEGVFDLAFQLGFGLPFGVGNALATESGFNATPQLSLGGDVGPVRVGGEVAAVLRPALALTTGTLRDTVGSQLGLRALVSSRGDGVRFEASVHTVLPLTGAAPPGFEVLAGARVPVGPVEFFILAGPGFGSMPGTPTFRVFAGVGLKPEGERCVEGSEHAPEDCPDLDDDRDGIKNSRDLCPLEPEDLDRFDDHDGCPDPDNDNDGVLDDDDKCPRQFGPKETQGCPAEGADRDGDGTRDLLDNCPDAAGPASNQGCPESEKQLVVITVEKLVIKERVYFETAKSNILSVSYPLLDQVSRVLREHPEIELVTVEGHTDDRGGAEYNQGLSMDRASSVKRYLEGKGIDPARLKAAGYGLTRPADTNATEEGRAANRRVEFIIDRSR